MRDTSPSRPRASESRLVETTQGGQPAGQDPAALLALQGSIGNAGVVALLAARSGRHRQPARRGTPPSSAAGALPEAIPLPRGGFRLLIDGDGDQHKDLDLRLKVGAVWPDGANAGAVKTLKVYVIQRSTGTTRLARFELPHRPRGGRLAPSVRETVTDGQRPTRISLLEDIRAATLEILPAVHTRRQSRYTLRVGDQSVDLAFARDPRRAKRVGAVTGSREDGGIHVLDITLGAYNDPFRLTFRRTAESTVTFGIQAMSGREPNGGGGAELTMLSGPLQPRVARSSPTTLAIDVNGDGRPDVFLYDRLTTAPRGFDGAGPPTLTRSHRIRAVGPALAHEAVFDFRHAKGALTSSRGERSPADRDAERDVAVLATLPSQRGLGRPRDALRDADGAALQNYRARVDAGLLPGEVVDAAHRVWLALWQLAHRPTAAGEADAALQAYRAAYVTAYRATVPPPANPRGVVPPPRAGERVAAAVRGGNPQLALREFTTMLAELDRLVAGAARARKVAIEPGRPNRDVTDDADVLRRRRDELVRMPADATRVAAAFHPNRDRFGREPGYRDTYPLEMYLWREGAQWQLRDVSNPTDAATFSIEAKPGESSPPPELFAKLDDPDYFPEGAISFQLPGGPIRRVATRGGMSWKVFLGRAAVILLVSGVVLSGVGAVAGSAAISVTATVLVDLASIASTSRAVLDMRQRVAHKNLDTETLVIDGLGLMGGAFHNTGTLSRIIVHTADRAAAGGRAVTGSMAAVAHLANRYYIPIARHAGAAIDGTVILAMTPFALERLREFERSPHADRHSDAARLELLAGLIATGAANVIRHRAGAAVAGYRNAYRGDLHLSRATDGRLTLSHLRPE